MGGVRVHGAAGMTVILNQSDVEEFRGLIARHFGFQSDNGRLDFLTDVLRRRMESTKCQQFSEYSALLDSSPARAEELRALAEHITVVETFFFRNADNFRALAERVLPERIQARAAERRLRVLSAGCASGDEPYSIAILLRDRFPELASWDVQIVGIDVNRLMLAKASAGRYSAWSLRATSDDVKRRHFRSEGRDFILDPAIRNMVSIHERNLVDADPLFWQSSTYDLVFCRNVLMYFEPEVMQLVVGRLQDLLVPEGFLFLGHAETLRGMTQEFHLCHTHNTFYYQKIGRAEAAIRSSMLPDVRSEDDYVPTPIPVDTTISWVDVIHGASERIATLAGSRAQVNTSIPSAPASADSGNTSSRDFVPVFEAMLRERFSDALVLLSALPAAVQTKTDTLLLRAALFTSSGRLADAEETCKQIIALDDLNAGAHYLLALCREHAGDLAATVEHDQIAIYLDPGFAMPHLHLGLIARRRGDVVEAHRALSQALILLAREDSSRILLFGGGFSREALVQLCRAGLPATGGDA